MSFFSFFNLEDHFISPAWLSISWQCCRWRCQCREFGMGGIRKKFKGRRDRHSRDITL